MAALMTVSEIIKNKDLDDKEPKKKSREDWRKAKELEEARKAGTAPAAVDEEGKDINPHIPQYISTAPWYYGAKGPTLKHQRPQPEKQKSFAKLSEWYHRGIPSAPIVTKYRKGACTNCGAMTHKKKDCLERPRRVGAKYSGQNIAPDEFMQTELPLDYDGKRDRWNGYDPSEHSTIIEEFRKVEDAKRQLKSDTLKEDAEKDVDEDIDEDKYVDEVDMPGTKVDSKQRITVRNLRIREDTAKYLRNLDPNSAYYDPKTRAMRENPYLNTGINPEEVDFAGENFVKYTGDTKNHAKAQLFAWEAYEKGVDIHLLAEPTKLELLQKEYGKVKENLKDSFKNNILEKYGGDEHLEVPPKELLLAQTECYIEYSRKGKIIKGDAKPVIRSKYKEDEFNNNHTQIWGSYWNEGQWGYKCCHSFVKNSYCVGMKGSLKTQEPIGSANLLENKEVDSDSGDEEESPKTLMQLHTEKLSQKKKKKGQVEPEEAVEDDRKLKLREALIKHEMEMAKAEKLLSLGDKKRPYNSMYDTKGPTEEEMEAYYLKKSRSEDPMANFLDT